MKKRIIQWRGFHVTKRELFADAIFLAVSAVVSFLIAVFMNIHWSFYPGNTLFPPSAIVGIKWYIYVIITLVGAIMGFFIIKIILIGVKEEEREWFHSKSKK